MSELPKSYDANHVDSKWYHFWEENGFFKVDPHSEKQAYTIVMPPPNVTGVLHMGHALVSTLQDSLIRWKRMSGYETLWIPGTDHAGIATQTVVERDLMQRFGKKRKDFTRDEFLAHTWDWKKEKEGNILTQLRRLGCSCDWSRLRFTMDEQNNRAVKAMFKKLYDEDLIYRGDYLVNWDPVTQTALADDEVEYEERHSFLWHFKYPLKNGTGYVSIATTRPETLLGDTAVAVSPRDSRYKSLIGQSVILPIMEREIPIIADHQVDPTFGTGMVKVTPAHDVNDYQMGLAHGLPFINIMTPDGKINANGGRFEGLTMEEARAAVIKEMESRGLLEKIEPHINRVGVSYRSKAVIEPYMSKQWFVRMSRFADGLKAAVKENRLQLIPKNWENTYFHWIDHLRDWCISRQLWWGHRIPIWYHKEDANHILCYEGDGEPPEVLKDPDSWVQEEDVLDTWFSSGLWPFSTLGWPEQTQELKKFYPNSVLVTGHDILFFWVARMAFLGEYAMGQLPFPEVFLHGLIYGKSYWRQQKGGGIAYLEETEKRDYERGKPVPQDVCWKWEKMSKSKGNIIDPLEIIDEYGTDAMRMALCSNATQAREIDLDRRRFEEFRNFANKIWNGARFIFMNLSGEAQLLSDEMVQGIEEQEMGLEDRWILSKLNRTVESVTQKLNAYLFDQAALEAYDFFWKEFCSYYLEIAKPVLFRKAGTAARRKNKQKILAIILSQSIRLLHPMAPFITEELFQLLKKSFDPELNAMHNADLYTKEFIHSLKAKACIIAQYPVVINAKDMNLEIENEFDLARQAVYTIRNIRGELKLAPGIATDVYLIGEAANEQFISLCNHLDIIASLVKVGEIKATSEEPKIGFASVGILGRIKIVIPMPKELLQQEITRLVKEQERLVKSIQKAETQLSNNEFLSNAPSQLVEKQRNHLDLTRKELKQIELKLASVK